MERIALAREYRVADWLRDAYLELTQKSPLDFEELQPAVEPCSDPVDSDWEANSKKWEELSRHWETLARISQVQTKVANSRIPVTGNYQSSQTCSTCRIYLYSGNACANLNCRVLAVTAMVDETIREELESLKGDPEHVEPPLPCKLPIYHICVL